jgi:hypothetical protein
VPHERADDFARYGRTIASALDGVRSPRRAAQLMRADNALAALFEQLFEQLFALRRREPADDVISLVVSAADEGRVRPAQMIPLCILLLVAGFETTVNLIGNVLALLAHPEQWRAVADDPTPAAAAVEETLRWDPPAQQTGRIALQDLDLDGPPRPQGAVRRDAARRREPRSVRASGPGTIRPGARTARQPDVLQRHPVLHRPAARAAGGDDRGAGTAQRHPQPHRAGRWARRNSTTIRGPLRLPVSG